MRKQMVNPLLPTYEYIPDCEPQVFGDRLYLYGSHDRFGGGKYCMNDYVCWSAPLSDLSDWYFHGVIYTKGQDPDNSDGREELWAPCVVRGMDDRYYMYYCLGHWYPKISVAVCDTPDGRYEILGHVRYADGVELGQKEGDKIPFDPAVLIDDGRIFVYSGCAPTPILLRPEIDIRKDSQCIELEQDMLTVKGEPRKFLPTMADSEGTGFEGHEFFEASAIRKYMGRYYCTYSSVKLHELCWAVSDQPDAGFTYGGVLVSNGDIFPETHTNMAFDSKPDRNVKYYIGNNHGNLIRIGGEYYIFYHRHTNHCMFCRQTCVERVVMTEDGRFLQARMTSYGLNGMPLAGKGTYEAAIACNLYEREGASFSNRADVPVITQEGEDRECLPGQFIQGIRNGVTAGYRSFVFQNAGGITLTARGDGRGVFLVRDEEDGNVVAEIAMEPCTDWSDFSAPLSIDNGEHPLYLTFTGTGTVDLLNLTLL